MKMNLPPGESAPVETSSRQDDEGSAARKRAAELRRALREKNADLLKVQRHLIGYARAHGYDRDDADLAALMPVETFPRDDAEGTTVAFAGLLIGFGMAQKEFFGTLSETRQSLVFVKDFEQLWYQRGLLGLSETRSGAAEVLREELAGLPRPWTFLGSSAGGYAALFYGAMLGADRMVAFAPQTIVGHRAFVEYAHVRPRIAGYDVNDPENDLLPHLERYPLQGQAFLHYGTGNAFDTEEALRVKDVPGIALVPHDLGNHSIARELRRSGTLLEAIYGGGDAAKS